jgi:hypothetical protein
VSAATSRLPAPKDICDLFTALLGRDVRSAPSGPVAVTRADPAVVAVYVDDKLGMYAVAVMDLPLAISCGAALALMPAHAAELAIASKALTELLADNIAEIVNIMTSLLAVPQVPHVKLHHVYQPGDTLPGDVAALAATFGSRTDLSLSIPGYGSGAMSFVLS